MLIWAGLGLFQYVLIQVVEGCSFKLFFMGRQGCDIYHDY